MCWIDLSGDDCYVGKEGCIEVCWRKNGKLYSRCRLKGWIHFLPKAANGWHGMSRRQMLLGLHRSGYIIFLSQCFGKKNLQLFWVCVDKCNLRFSFNWPVVSSAEKSRYYAFWIYLVKKVYTVSLNSFKCWK